MQGSNRLINELYQDINAFERKLKLLEKQITEKNFMHFLQLETNHLIYNSIYINFIQDLRQPFAIRFTDVHSKKADVRFQPFEVEPDIADEDF